MPLPKLDQLHFGTQTAASSKQAPIVRHPHRSPVQREKDTLNAIYFTANPYQTNPFKGFPKGIAKNGQGDTVIHQYPTEDSLDEVHVFSPSFVLDSRWDL